MSFKLFLILQGKFFWQVKIGYTIGHSVSLISLTTAIVILCIFRYVEKNNQTQHRAITVTFLGLSSESLQKEKSIFLLLTATQQREYLHY